MVSEQPYFILMLLKRKTTVTMATSPPDYRDSKRTTTTCILTSGQWSSSGQSGTCAVAMAADSLTFLDHWICLLIDLLMICCRRVEVQPGRVCQCANVTGTRWLRTMMVGLHSIYTVNVHDSIVRKTVLMAEMLGLYYG